ncbi:MAG: hypothetical protein JO196_05130 [Hyphomicrobiales bacterium]|nr:hypothetical protein [Hyphomicrobiales bacterium]MBV9751850.1 hypothetical protein [Hyphomicrobiales bacterium]
MSKMTLALLASTMVAFTSPCLAEGGGSGAGGGYGGAGYGANSYYNICRHEVRSKFCPTGTCPRGTKAVREAQIERCARHYAGVRIKGY